MPREAFSQVVTAQDLLAGDVIYLAADDTWVRDLSEAEILTDEAVAQDRLISAARQTGHVVGAYLADVHPGRNGPEPVHFREAFRATGPSNYAHGKRAERRHV
jgi:hypothetical protein